MGRLTRQIDLVDNGTTSGYDRQLTYIANGPYDVWHRFNGREMNYTTFAGSPPPLARRWSL